MGDLEGSKIMLAELEAEKKAAVERSKELEDMYQKQQNESQNMMDVMHNQVRQLQTEKVELKRLMGAKLQTDAQHVANLEVRNRLLAEQATQTDEDHRQRAKFLQEELASEKRLRETFELVNGTLKASVSRLEKEMGGLRTALNDAQDKATAMEESTRVQIDRNMYERISIKLQARVGDSESS